MKKIGMIVATVREMESALKKYGKAKEVNDHGTTKVHTYEMSDYVVYICNSGFGEIAAAAATQLLISKYEVDVIFNYGVVGGLTEEMTVTKNCIVTSVVHYDFDVSYIDDVKPAQYTEFEDVYIPTTKNLWTRVIDMFPDLKPVVCASGDKFLHFPQDKIDLHEKFGADICEMEAASIALTAYRNNIPCLLIKSVSDSVSGGAEEFNEMIRVASDECMKIVEQVIVQL